MAPGFQQGRGGGEGKPGGPGGSPKEFVGQARDGCVDDEVAGGSRAPLPPCACRHRGEMWRGGGCVDRHRRVCAGASPFKLALTARILSVWLTRRPRPRFRAPASEIRLLLQQKGVCLALPCRQICRATLPQGCWCNPQVQPPSTPRGPWAGQCVDASVECPVFRVQQMCLEGCCPPTPRPSGDPLLFPGPRCSVGAPTHPTPCLCPHDSHPAPSPRPSAPDGPKLQASSLLLATLFPTQPHFPLTSQTPAFPHREGRMGRMEQMPVPMADSP